MKFDEFWIVWSPTGHTPPSVRHASAESARVEAERLARMSPGSEFYVLVVLARVRKSDVSWQLAAGTSDDWSIPF